MFSKLDLTGRYALVGGASQGIGRAIAQVLSELNATVVLVARSEEKLKAALGKLSRKDNQEHHFIVADYFQPEKLRKKVEDYLSTVTSIEILINNTGGPPGGPALNASLSAYTDVFRQHLLSNQALVQTVVPGMKDSGYGRIVNILSLSVKQPVPNLGVSNTIRGAVAQWGKTLANELAPFGITVNNVLPGMTDTARLQSIIESRAKKNETSIEEETEKMMRDTPMGRLGRPEEIAYAVGFLCSPAASFVTGINLPVDGGRIKGL